MDFTFAAGTDSSIFLHPDVNLAKLLNHPGTRRLYLHHIHDLCQTAFNTDYLDPWLDHYGRMAGQNFSAASSYVANRRAFALTQLPAWVPFAITSNDGLDFSAPTNVIILSGSGWIDVRSLRVNGIPATVDWTTLTNWTLAVSLEAGADFLVVQAADRHGNLLAQGTDTITVTNTAPPPPSIETIAFESRGKVSILFTTSAGHLYEVQCAEDARAPQWRPLVTLRATAQSHTVTEAIAPTTAQRFYRVLLVQ